MALRSRYILSAPAITAALAMAGSATAQSTPPAPAASAETAPEVQESQQANREQAALAAKQLEQNAANQAEYEARRASYEAQMRLYQHNIDDRERVQQQYDTIKALYDRIYKQWEADVAACNAGDRTRCGPPVEPKN